MSTVTIDETLRHGERGILFIGAYHNVKGKLPCDIEIIEIKDTQKIREYQRLLPYRNKDGSRFEELSRYLISKVEVAQATGCEFYRSSEIKINTY